jgi:hypothetical protein
MSTAPTIASPWMTAAECAVYLRYVRPDGAPDLDRLYHAKQRLGLPASHMGGSRTLRFHRQYVDEWVERGSTGRAAALEAKLRAVRAPLRRAR